MTADFQQARMPRGCWILAIVMGILPPAGVQFVKATGAASCVGQHSSMVLASTSDALFGDLDDFSIPMFEEEEEEQEDPAEKRTETLHPSRTAASQALARVCKHFNPRATINDVFRPPIHRVI